MNVNAPTLYAQLAHETRLRCLLLLLAHEQLCVCELTHALGLAQPHVSRHLASLREAALVQDRRAGLWIHYRINPALPAWVQEVLSVTAAGLARQAPFADDAAALAAMPARPGGLRCA